MSYTLVKVATIKSTCPEPFGPVFDKWWMSASDLKILNRDSVPSSEDFQ